MGCVPRENCRRLRLLLAALATLGLELDVFCNPFSPELILSVLASTRAPGPVVPAGPGGSVVSTRMGGDTRSGRSREAVIDRVPTLSEAVALGPRLAPTGFSDPGAVLATSFPLFTLSFHLAIGSPLASPHGPAVLIRFCRFLC